MVISGGSLARLEGLEVARGDLLMLGADLVWALYNVLSRRHMPSGSALSNTALITAVGAILLFGVALGDGGHLSVPGGKAASALLVMTLGGTVLAYLFWNTGIAHLGAGSTALFLNLVPLFAMLVSAAIGIQPSTMQLIGGALVIGGVSIAMMPRRQVVMGDAA